MIEQHITHFITGCAHTQRRPARVGIMGGTFDPIHIGHIKLAQAAYDELHLDCVVFVVAGEPAFKQDVYVTPATHRLNMTERAIAHRCDWFVSACEVDREGITHTIDTLEELSATWRGSAELFLILGEDAFATLDAWYRSAEIASLCQVVWAERVGVDILDSARVQACELVPGAIRLSTSIPAISSTQIRTCYASHQSIDDLVQPEVYQYIVEHNLYQGVAS